MRLRPPAILPLSLPPTELDANRPWWKRIEHQLDGVSPPFFLSPKRQRHAVNNRAASLAEMVNVQNNSAIRTHIDKDGVLQTAPANTPRIDWSFGYPRLLLEGAATNYIQNSKTWAGGFSASRATLQTGIASPDGLLNAARVTCDGGNDPIFFAAASTGLIAGKTYTFSLWAKTAANPGGHNPRAKLYVYGSTGVEQVQEKNIVLTDQWARYTFTVTFTSGAVSTVLTARIDPYDGTIGAGGATNQPVAGSQIDVFGFQVEEGSVATSYIATTGTVLTRTADLAPLHSSAGDMTAWAWRGYVPSPIVGQVLLGITGGACIIGAGAADPSQVRLEGHTANVVLAARSGVLPGDLRFCGGFGASGRRVSDNGSAANADAIVPDRLRTSMFIGRATGLVAGQVIYLDELVGWILPDRPSAAGVQAQARAAA